MEIEVRGLEELNRKLNKIASGEALRRGMEAAVTFAEDFMSTYPRRPSYKGKMNFVSDKQRRFFFAALRDGRIQVPYVRGNKLGQSWTKKVTTEGGNVVGRVGNNRTYGPFVQDRQHQHRMFRSIWPTTQDFTEGNLTRRRVTEAIQQEIDKALEG